MAHEDAAHDANSSNVAMGVTNDSNLFRTMFRVDPVTKRLLVDASGGGGGIQYDEDDPHTSGDTGTMALAVRNDTPSALAGTDGDYIPLTTNSEGKLHSILSGRSSSGVIDAVAEIVEINCDGLESVNIYLNGTWNGQIEFQYSNDGLNYHEISQPLVKDWFSGSWVTTISGAVSDSFELEVNVGAFKGFRVFAGAWTSGSVSIVLNGKESASTFTHVVGDRLHNNSDNLTPPIKIGGYASAAAPTSVSADALRVNAWFLRNGAQATVLTAAGALIGGDATNGLDVDVTRIIPGTTATALGKAEDAAHTTGDTGVMILAVRQDSPSQLAGAGDYTVLFTDAVGKLWTADNQAEDAAHSTGDRGSFALAVSNESNTVRAADGDYIAFATDTEGNQRVIGNRDHDAVDAGETVKIGGFATSTNQTRVASGDRTHFISDLAGRQIANLGQVRELRSKQTTTISASTTETTIGTAVASTYLDLVALIISNTSASTNTRIDFRDTTAGTILFSLQVPANQTTGFSIPGSAIPQTSVNTNWTAQCGTSTTDIRILAIFERNT